MSFQPIIKSANPDFNYEAAQKAYNIIMKMGEDEARVFSQMVIGEMLEEDIERNKRTLQRHLDDVCKRRFETIKKAMATTVAKSDDPKAAEYRAALEEIEKAWQNPYETGRYKFDESDFRRDAGTGRFQRKIHVDPRKGPLTDEQAANLGIEVKDAHYATLEPEQKAQYQQEYMQIANFLNSVQANGQLGDHDVHLMMQDENGDRYYKQVNGKPQLNPKTSRVVGIEARPTNLTLGGASFGLINALGGGSTRGIDRADNKFPEFSNSWAAADYNSMNTNEQLYDRISAGSKFVTQVAPFGSHAQIAARMAQVVGDHGREAEKVFGPSVRRAAYRYRGTERQPDQQVIEDYANAVRTRQARDMLRSERIRSGNILTADQEGELRRRQSQARQNAREFLWRRANEGNTGAIPSKPGTREYDPETSQFKDTPNFVQFRDVSLSRKQTADINQRTRDDFLKEIAPKGNEPSLHGAEAGRAVLIRHLDEVAPNKDLFGLQLASGNTPPSEGFLIDAKGQIRAQAIGYGDDHYLPFNLKHLKELKGGEYIRSRSVGGPTSEDIYTGLMTGARRITVVSRSGVYTVNFQDDFRGGRRYNDKARRMTRRYEQILDAVQSEQVERSQPISPVVRERITSQVRENYGGLPRQRQRQLIKDKLDEYKNELEMTVGDQDEFRAYVDEQAADLPEQQRVRLEAELMNDWKRHSEFKFKLNGEGYHDALKALHEQFPYYIHEPSYEARKAAEHFSTEKDDAYVEPGRLRPTKANAGWYGTSSNPGTGFISASHVDYQRGPYGKTTLNHIRPSGPKGSADIPVDESTNAEIAGANGEMTVKERATSEQAAQQRLAEIHQKQDYAKEAVAFVNKIKRSGGWERDKGLTQFQFMDQDDEALTQHFKTPEGVADLNRWISGYSVTAKNQNIISEADLIRLRAAAGGVTPKEYTKAQQLSLGPPQIFTGLAYEDNAPEEAVKRELKALSSVSSVTIAKPITELSEPERRHEIGVLRSVMEAMPALKDLSPDAQKVELKRLGATTGSPLKLTVPEQFDAQAEGIQRVRSLEKNRPAALLPQTSVTEVKEITTGRDEIPTAADTFDQNRAELADRQDTFREAIVKLKAHGHDRDATRFQQIVESIQDVLNDSDPIDDDTFNAMNDAFDKHYETAKSIVRRNT